MLSGRTPLFTLILAFILVVTVVGNLVIVHAAQQTGNGADAYRVAVDQNGHMRLLGPDSNGKYRDDIQPNEFAIDLPSLQSIVTLNSGLGSLQSMFNTLNSTVSQQQIKITQLEQRIAALESSANGTFINDSSLVLNLPLYELQGNSFLSRDAYGHLVTVTGTVWTPQGRAFNGTSDLMTIAHNSTIKPDQYTVEIWLKPDADVSIYRDIITSIQNGDGNLQGYHIRVDQGTGRVLARSGNGTLNSVVVGNAINDNAWHHVVAVLNTSNLTLYQEGVLVNQTARRPGIYYDSSDPRIGHQYGWFKGIIGEIRIYNRALTPQEIQKNYLATKARYQ